MIADLLVIEIANSQSTINRQITSPAIFNSLQSTNLKSAIQNSESSVQAELAENLARELGAVSAELRRPITGAWRR